MVGVGGCPCARRERERQRRREEVGWVWVVVVVAGLCRRSFVELRRGGTVGLGVSLRSSPRVRRVPPESESGLQRGGGAALPWRAVRGSLRHAPMPCSPVCAEERKKCTRAEERGSFFAEQRADGGGGEARRDDEKGGGALFCLRPQWVVLRGRGLWVLRGSVRVRFARWYAPGGGQE